MSLNAIVRVYTQRIRPKARAEIDWFQQQPTLKSAIELAALARNSRGKRFSHQRRLKKVHLEEAKQALLANSRAIAQSGNFDDLFALIEKVVGPISGIGELYVYDTSLRVGAKLGLLPNRVYLHAGTRRGAEALGFDGKTRTLDKSLFPREFQQLEAHEIEDVLCIFEEDLKTTQIESSGLKLTQRSWCS